MTFTAKTHADFKGLLLQARRKAGQRHVLLLFRTSQGLRFCLSKNLKLVQSMRIGQTYHVKGREFTTGDKSYLNITSAKIVVPRGAVIRRRIGLIASAASVLIILGFIGTGLVSRQAGERSSAGTGASGVPASSTTDETTPRKAGKAGKINNVIKQPNTETPAPKSTTNAGERHSGDTDVTSSEPLESVPVVTPEPPLEPTPTPPTPEPQPSPAPPPPPPAESFMDSGETEQQ